MIISDEILMTAFTLVSGYIAIVLRDIKPSVTKLTVAVDKLRELITRIDDENDLL